jgi:hypothetical protein
MTVTRPTRDILNMIYNKSASASDLCSSFIIFTITSFSGSLDSSAGIVADYGLEDERNQGSIPRSGKGFSSSPQCPDRLRPSQPTIKQTQRLISQG